MTVIIGCIDPATGDVLMGGDSAAVSNDLDIIVSAQPKVFRNGEFIFGFAGDFRWGQLLRFVHLPKAKAKCDIDRFIAIDLGYRLREAAIDMGVTTDAEGQTTVEGNCLFGFRGRLYKLQANFSALEIADGIATIGVGGVSALGAMLASPAVETEARILNALTISEYCCAGVRPPYTLIRLEKYVHVPRKNRAAPPRHRRRNRAAARRAPRRDRKWRPR